MTALLLPDAPPVVRAVPTALRRPRLPAVALLVLGVLLAAGPVVGGLFATTAAGTLLLDEFEPHLDPDALARYDGDLARIRAGAAAVDAVGPEAGRFPGIDRFRVEAAGIDARATALLDRVGAAEPDYRQVAAIGGFDRVPFLLVVAGLVATYGACVLLWGRTDRARVAVGLVVLAGAALAAHPFVSGLHRGAAAGERLLDALAPVMTAEQVGALQADFIVLVHAVGELDTGFRQAGPLPADVAALVDAWPTISSDLAGLVGDVNDTIDDYEALASLDDVAGLGALPWLLAGVGAASAGLAIAAWPRRRKDPP